MTKIIKNKKQSDMYSHIKKAHDILNEHLPNLYVNKVSEKLSKKISLGTIRNVRHGLSNNIEVLNALVEVALENKSNIEKLKKITN